MAGAAERRQPPLAPPSVRKSSHGRTSLFVPSKGTLFREVRCMGGVTRTATASLYHVCSPLHSLAGPVACWHCCETIPTGAEKIPIPRVYDRGEQAYHVQGATCSPECAKAYVMEHSSFDRPHQLHILTKMLQEVYGCVRYVTEAPPRQALVRFGGVMHPPGASEGKVGGGRATAVCRLVEPPFVSYCMLAEERSVDRKEGGTSLSSLLDRVGLGLGGEDDRLEEAEDVPGDFEAYVERRKAEADAKKVAGGGAARKEPREECRPLAVVSETRDGQGKRPREVKRDPAGPLAKFVRKGGGGEAETAARAGVDAPVVLPTRPAE